jgi:para-aminobenzoate synthetase
MRTLLIDNYDSFTYNLYQYLAASNGQLPAVVRNDQLSWGEAATLPFENIVISPGRGRPQRANDLGISGSRATHCATRTSRTRARTRSRSVQAA